MVACLRTPAAGSSSFVGGPVSHAPRRPLVWRRFNAAARPLAPAEEAAVSSLPATQPTAADIALAAPAAALEIRRVQVQAVSPGAAASPAASGPPTVVPATAPEPAATSSPSPASSSAAGPASVSRFSSLYNWLRYGGQPLKLRPEQEQQEDDTALFGDGMAAGPLQTPAAAAASASGRRGLLSLRRGTGSTRQTAAAAAAGDAAAEPQLNMDHPTLQLLRQRLAEGSKPGARRDSFKLGLVVEGGGMRGCVSGGALQALSDLGMRDVFDALYGSSAGAINSCYFLSGQRDGVRIYHEHIAHTEFIDLKRLWKSEPDAPVLNLTYLIDYVMHHVSPLDWDAVVQSEIPLKVVASSLDVLQPIILEDFACKNDLAASLRASANVPEIAGSYVVHRGHRLVDAAVFEPVPFRSAIADGCTHVLVLCTRPKKERKGVLLPLEDAIEAAIKRAVLSPDYMVPAWRAEMEYMAKDGLSQDDMLLRSFDEDAHELPWFAGAHVFPLYPGAPASFSPLCTDVPTLKAGVAEGRRAVMQLARALLRDVLDSASQHREEVLEPLESNIMPLAGPLARAADAAGQGRRRLARLWRR